MLLQTMGGIAEQQVIHSQIIMCIVQGLGTESILMQEYEFQIVFLVMKLIDSILR